LFWRRRDAGFVVDANANRVGFALGLRSQAALALPATSDTVLHIQLPSDAPGSARVSVDERTRP
jgi:hypothetical protein